MSAADNLRGDRRNLLRRLPQSEHDFGKALPHRAVVVHLGKPKVLKGLLAKRGQQPLVGVGRVGSAVVGPVEKGRSPPVSCAAIVRVLLTLRE